MNFYCSACFSLKNQDRAVLHPNDLPVKAKADLENKESMFWEKLFSVFSVNSLSPSVV